MESAESERRAHARVVGLFPAHCRIAGRFSRESVENLSPLGLLLRTRRSAELGTLVRLVLPLPMRTGVDYCTVVGKVSRQEEVAGVATGLGLAVCESEMSRGDLAAWRAFWAESVQVTV